MIHLRKKELQGLLELLGCVEISAKHYKNKDDKVKNWLRHECSSMRYYRSLDFPEEIKSDNVNAEMKNGVLTVILQKVKPKSEQKAKESQY